MRGPLLCMVLVALQSYSLRANATHDQTAQWIEDEKLACVEKRGQMESGADVQINLEDMDPALFEDLELQIRDALLAALEQVRAGMISGFPALGIPPLDPFVLGNVPFNATWDDNMVYGNLNNTELHGLSHFIPTQMFVNVQFALFINMTVETATIELNGTYDMGGNALGLDVTGDGKYRIDLHDLRFMFYTFFRLAHLGKFLQVGIMAADFVLGDTEVHFEHLMGGGVVGNLINNALSAGLPVILKGLEDQLLPPLIVALTDSVNEILCQHPILPFIP